MFKSKAILVSREQPKLISARRSLFKSSLQMASFFYLRCMIRIYLIGITILIIAILANAVIVQLGWKSWYNFIELSSSSGSSAFNQLSIIDVLWLFFGYPFVLGFGYWIGDQFYKLLF